MKARSAYINDRHQWCEKDESGVLQQSLLDRRCLGGTEDFVKSMGDKGAGPGKRRNILDSEPQVASRGKIIEGLTEIRNLLLNAWFRRLDGSDHLRMKVEPISEGNVSNCVSLVNG